MHVSRLVRLLAVISFLSTNVAFAGPSDDILLKVKLEHCSQPKNKNDSFCAGFVAPNDQPKKVETKPVVDPQIAIKQKQEQQAKADLAAAQALAAKQAAEQAKNEKEALEAAAAKAAADAKAELEAALAEQALLLKQAEAEAKLKADSSKTVVTKTEDSSGTVQVDTVTVTTTAEYTGPARAAITNDLENKAHFDIFCDWNGDIAVAPVPKYEQALVKRAAQILTRVSGLYAKDFYFYPETRKFYREASEKGPAEYSKEARIYLTQVCGEFRDRAEMVESKIRWVNNIFILPDEVQKSETQENENKIDYSVNIWSQLSGRSYNDYLIFADTLFNARASQAIADNFVLQKALGRDAEAAVSPNTVCETKYMIGKYIAEGRAFDNLSAFTRGYKDFEADSTKCSPEDKEYYYNFRGDANFKEYSGESNAMIWHARSIGDFCASATTSNQKDPDISDEDCQEYIRKPFLSRYNAARSGLAAWLLYRKEDESKFASQTSATFVLPKFDKNVGKLPFEMKLSDGTIINNNINLVDSTLGFNDMFNLGEDGKANLSAAFERLKHAVNRHTNWYKSGYHNESTLDEKPVDEKGRKLNDFNDQAYSPFVASSYEMSKSNQFAQCGYTIQCPNPLNRKSWMFVFKIKKENWYNTHSLAANLPINFDKAWLDETTFGTDRLAQIERAFDRLGTPLEEEFDSILYLRNLNGGGHGTNDPQGARPVANDKVF